MRVTAFIGLGSNVGDRAGYLDAALSALRAMPGVTVTNLSRYWDNPPIGGPSGQENYLNAVAQLETDLSARQLLAVLLGIEERLGRIRQERWGPRTIDLDLLLFGDQIIDEDGLHVPHPRMHERGFVLGPLTEIAGTALHPILQARAVDLLMRHCGSMPSGSFGASNPSGPAPRVVVTGSSSGIGRAVAMALASHGADVLVHARASLSGAEETRDRIRQLGRKSQVALANLSDGAALAEFADQAWRDFGPIDVWVNNAGADTLTGDNARLSFEEKLDLLWCVDVLATVRLSRLIGEHMKHRGQGVIINVGWDQAETGMEGDSGQLFAATKGAVMAFTRSLAVSLAPEVRVNCVAPGWIKTAWGETASESWQSRAMKEAPLGRWGTPEDVAAAVCWLASPQATFVTGQVIRVNGGAVR